MALLRLAVTPGHYMPGGTVGASAGQGSPRVFSPEIRLSHELGNCRYFYCNQIWGTTHVFGALSGFGQTRKTLGEPEETPTAHALRGCGLEFKPQCPMYAEHYPAALLSVIPGTTCYFWSHGNGSQVCVSTTKGCHPGGHHSSNRRRYVSTAANESDLWWTLCEHCGEHHSHNLWVSAKSAVPQEAQSKEPKPG